MAERRDSEQSLYGQDYARRVAVAKACNDHLKDLQKFHRPLSRSVAVTPQPTENETKNEDWWQIDE